MFYDISVFVININISYYYSTSQLHIERGRNHDVVCSVKTRWKNLLGENEVTGNRRANRSNAVLSILSEYTHSFFFF